MFNRKLRRATVNGFFRHSENADLNRNGQIANIDVKQETLPFKITVANERLGLANKQLHRFDLEIDISPSRMHRQVARWLCHFSAFFCRPNSVFFFCGSQRTFVCEPKQRQDPLNLAYSSFQYVSGFLFLYYSSSLYLGQLNRVRLNLWTYIVVFAAGMHASYNVATLFAFSSVNWQFIDMNRNIFRIPSPQVSHDDQFKFSWTWNSMLNYVRYMQCSCRREKIQLCICDRDKKQLKTKRTWNGVSGTHTTFALSTQWILQMQCNFFSLVPVLIIKKFPFIGFTPLGTRDQIKLSSFEKVCIFSERKFLFANFTSRK